MDIQNRIYAREGTLETRANVLTAAIESIQFATLITPSGNGVKVTHMPMMVRQDATGKVRLIGHFARANDHWKLLQDETLETAAVFQGPYSYITPANYATKQETGKVVPTWSYIVVHAHGKARAVQDRDWLLQAVNELTDSHEAAQPTPWKVSDAPGDYIDVMLRGIVGLEMEVSLLEGVWKLNQHRSDADKQNTIAALTASTSDRERQLGAIMDKVINGSS